MVEAYADYPPTPKNGGLIADTDVRNWVRRWIYRDDEICLVKELSGNPVGFITYRVGPYVGVVDQVIVHPDFRKQGHARAMINEVIQILFDKGVLVATFQTLGGTLQKTFGRDGVVTVDEAEKIMRGTQ